MGLPLPQGMGLRCARIAPGGRDGNTHYLNGRRQSNRTAANAAVLRKGHYLVLLLSSSFAEKASVHLSKPDRRRIHAIATPLGLLCKYSAQIAIRPYLKCQQ